VLMELGKVMALPDWDAHEAAIDDAIATCDDHLRVALKALINVNEHVNETSTRHWHRRRRRPLASFVCLFRIGIRATKCPLGRPAASRSTTRAAAKRWLPVILAPWKARGVSREPLKRNKKAPIRFLVEWSAETRNVRSFQHRARCLEMVGVRGGHAGSRQAEPDRKPWPVPRRRSIGRPLRKYSLARPHGAKMTRRSCYYRTPELPHDTLIYDVEFPGTFFCRG
jgi:hypothetical protein